MYVVEHCPDDLFRPGATFTVTGFDYTLEIGGWPEGTVFTGRGQRVVIQNGQVIELQDDVHGDDDHRDDDHRDDVHGRDDHGDDDHGDGEYRLQSIVSEVRSICED